MATEPNTDGGVGSGPPRTVLGRRPIPFEIRPTTVGTDQVLSLGVDTHAAREPMMFGCLMAGLLLMIGAGFAIGSVPPVLSGDWWAVVLSACVATGFLALFVVRMLRARQRALFVQFTMVPDEVAVLEGSDAPTAPVTARAQIEDVRIEVREIGVSVQHHGSAAWSGFCALLHVDGRFVPLACVKNMQEMDEYLARLPVRLRGIKREVRPRFEAHGNLRLAGSRSSV